MEITRTQQATTEEEPASTQPGSAIRLHGRWLLFARSIWVLIALLSVVLFIAAIPVTYDQLSNLLLVSDPTGRSVAQEGLASLGLSPDFFAAYALGTAVIRTLVYFAISAVVFAKKSDDIMGYFVSLFLLTFSVGRMMQILIVSATWVPWAPFLTTVAYSSFVLFFYIFPNGRFVPTWTRFVAPVWFVVIALAFFFPNTGVDITSIPYGYSLSLTSILALGAFAQIYRYRRAASVAEKQQIKWIVYGAAIILALNVIFSVPGYLDPSLALGSPPGALGVLYTFITVTITLIQLLIIPTSLAIAILRYHLWNVDLIINRTLVYVPLTAFLAGGYAATVALLQRLFIAITGQQSDAAIIVTTLALTASFTPIKNGLQTFVDRRFKEAPDSTRALRALGLSAQMDISVVDPRKATSRLLDEAVAAFHATTGAAYLQQNGHLQLVHTYGEWHDGDAQITIPLDSTSGRLGLLKLGPHRNGRDYSMEEQKTLQEVSDQIGAAISGYQ